VEVEEEELAGGRLVLMRELPRFPVFHLAQHERKDRDGINLPKFNTRS
jgi:hypothetical protein